MFRFYIKIKNIQICEPQPIHVMDRGCSSRSKKGGYLL